MERVGLRDVVRVRFPDNDETRSRAPFYMSTLLFVCTFYVTMISGVSRTPRYHSVLITLTHSRV